MTSSASVLVVIAGERADALGQRLGLEERAVGPRIHRVLHRRNLRA